MRRMFLLILTASFVLGAVNVSAEIQDQFVRRVYLEHEKQLGGECELLKSSVVVEDDIVHSIFEIEVMQRGNYYASLWIRHLRYEGKPLSVTVYLDDSKMPIGRFVMDKSGFQSAAICSMEDTNPVALSLSAGKHTLVFTNSIPVIPTIGFIRFSLNKDDAEIDDTEYREHIEYLSSAPVWPGEEFEEVAAPKIAMTEDDPQCEYKYEMGYDFNNTYMDFFYFNANTAVDFETYKDPTCGSDPVMYLFQNTLEPTYSWANDNYSGCQARIDTTITVAGSYVLMVRAKYPASPGTSDLYLNSNLLVSNIKVGGGALNTSSMDGTYTHQTGDLNFFCCPNNIDSYSNFMYLSTGNTDPVEFFKFGYTGGSGEFPTSHTRIKTDDYNGSALDYVLFSVNTSDMTDVGDCDVYVGLPPVTSIYTWAKLTCNNDDAILTDSGNGGYNCFAWAGGETTWIALDHLSSWWSGTALATLDAYLSNDGLDRYTGAITYTREGADSSNGIIAAWGSDPVHASVRNPGNGHPHGYDWESKLGPYDRVMHPRDELTYGTINYWYTLPTSPKRALKTTEFITMDESIVAGLTIREEVIMKQSELNILDGLFKQLSLKEQSKIVNAYSEWKKTWSLPENAGHSRLFKYSLSQEYSDFINMCREYGNPACAYVFLKFISGDFICLQVINDLTYDNHMDLIDEVKQEKLNNLYTPEGVYIAPSLKANVLNYLKKLIALPQEDWVRGTENREDGTIQKQSSNAMITANPNPFNPTTTIQFSLINEEVISLNIYDVIGRKVTTLMKNDKKSTGSHFVEWNGRDDNGNSVSSVIFFCRLMIGEDIHTLKLTLIR